MFFSLYSWHEIFDKNIYFCTNLSHIQGNYDYKLKAQSHFISMPFANKFFDTHVDDIKHNTVYEMIQIHVQSQCLCIALSHSLYWYLVWLNLYNHVWLMAKS